MHMVHLKKYIEYILNIEYMSSHAGIYDIFWYYGTNNTKVKLNQMHMLQKALTLVAVVFSEDMKLELL